METKDLNTITQIIDQVGIEGDMSFNDIKKLKSEKGLIERTESAKMVITEDNKQLLID